MAIRIRRREFIRTLGGTAVAWPLAARAQPPAMPLVGFLSTRAPGEDAHLLAAFHQGLKEMGYIEGQNLLIEYRFAENRYERLPALAADLARLRVAVIAAVGSPSAPAAKGATATIPIVFSIGTDPVATGLVANLSRPAICLDGSEHGATLKRLGTPSCSS
jgi:putative ABC transport system substrate-binding protein